MIKNCEEDMQKLDLQKRAEALITLCRRALDAGERIVITGHDSPDADSIISSVMMRKFLEKFNISAKISYGTRPDGVTERDMAALLLLDEISFEGFDADDLILLVDHHKSFYENRTLACVDHHTTLPEPEGEVTVVLSASSCGRVIFDMADALGVADGELERLAIYSVYLDTQSCRSPKFKKADEEWLERGIEKYKIDRGEIERIGFCLNDSAEDAESLSLYGLKKYSFGARPSFSSCIQIDTADKAWGERIPEIIESLKMRLLNEGGCVWAFVLNMPIEKRSDIYFIESNGAIQKVELDRLASRSRDVIPIVSLAQ